MFVIELSSGEGSWLADSMSVGNLVGSVSSVLTFRTRLHKDQPSISLVFLGLVFSLPYPLKRYALFGGSEAACLVRVTQ